MVRLALKGLEGGGTWFSSSWRGDLTGERERERALLGEPTTVEASKLIPGDLAEVKAGVFEAYRTL